MERIPKWMTKLLNVKIETKIRRAFLISLLIALFALWSCMSINLVLSIRYPKALSGYGYTQGTLGFALSCIGCTDGAVHDYIAFSNYKDTSAILSEFDIQSQLVINYMSETKELLINKDDILTCDNIITSWNEYISLGREILYSDETLNIKAMRIVSELDPMYEDVSMQIGILVNQLINEADVIENRLSVLSISSLISEILLIILTTILMIRFRKALTADIVPRITDSTDRIVALSNGDLHSTVHVNESNDELSTLSEGVSTIVSQVGDMIRHLTLALTELSSGNFTWIGDNPNLKAYPGDYAFIINKLIEVCNTLKETMREVLEVSTQVAVSAGQMADASQSLAIGSTDQANAIDQLLNGIKHFSLQVKETAEKANTANSMAIEVKTHADNGAAQMREMIDSMSRINTASDAISAIADDIAAIAAKTNLLSLNASIEAARAGDAGKGFAVVAGEIMTLANQSKIAVEHTRSLIDECRKEVSAGTNTVTNVANALNETIEMIGNIQADIQDIDDAATKQNNSMSGLSDAIEQISSIVESNSAAAEETSAVSEELKAQADLLNESLNRFKIE